MIIHSLRSALRQIEKAANERVTGPPAGDIMRYTLAPILGRVM